MSLGAAAPHPAKTDLLSDYSTVARNQVVRLGWRFKLEKHWHVYWSNPGDSGTAPKLVWKDLPKGVIVDDIEWPIPSRINVGPLTNFGYEGEVILPFNVKLENVEGPVRLRAVGKWLVCKEICIPGSAELALTLPVAGTAEESKMAPLLRALPLPNPSPGELNAFSQGEQIVLSVSESVVTPDNLGVIKAVDFFPARPGELKHPVVPQWEKTTSGFRLLLTPDSTLSKPLEKIDGLLVFLSDKGRVGFSISAIPITKEPSVVDSKLLQMALFALLGGLILNLMPCVFPVLSIKILGFVEQSKQAKQKVRIHGWMFFLGVMASFWVLTAVLLILRAAGQKLGWGFQLQSPLFLFGLATLLFFMAMNLLGTFEIGTSMMGIGAQLSGKEGYAGSFFTGVLATIVATPCTAPFMGTAVGFALAQPPIAAIVVFSAVGVGMASPYLILTYSPALLKLLPKPGRWMETFKQLMAFPLFGTVIWLVWVFGQQTGMDGVLRMLTALLFFALGIYFFSRWESRNKGFQFARLTAALCIVGGIAFGFQGSRLRGVASASVGGEGTYPVTWEKFSEAKLAELRGQNKAVFLDFTAAWCVSCQVNEKLVFSSEEVRRRFQELGVVAMKADWTDGDPLITAMLEKFQRSGVPFYLLYGKDGKKAPEILPEVLTPAIVLAALERLQ